ncbi:MAG TPA: PIN domain-containing protein [Hellea balneolensis]|uniref:PIN domain-containing protein n=1 Tax=Hellea balneolensis TaxID=287478 RepID=A0A7V5NW48_9PROT|nr:PIN domain-containing protein [Hellea balneolensis]
MSAFVLDCSVAISWCIEDEVSVETDALLERTRDFGAYVPDLWGYEVSNVLLQAHKRGRLSENQISAMLELLWALPVTIVSSSDLAAFKTNLTLAMSEKLTTYDAAYLALALSKHLPLATMDKALRRACGKLGIKVLPKVDLSNE